MPGTEIPYLKSITDIGVKLSFCFEILKAPLTLFSRENVGEAGQVFAELTSAYRYGANGGSQVVLENCFPKKRSYQVLPRVIGKDPRIPQVTECENLREVLPSTASSLLGSRKAYGVSELKYEPNPNEPARI